MPPQAGTLARRPPSLPAGHPRPSQGVPEPPQGSNTPLCSS